jgi:hypothetical protein
MRLVAVALATGRIAIHAPHQQAFPALH